mgnify:CR=1 FL=1
MQAPRDQPLLAVAPAEPEQAVAAPGASTTSIQTTNSTRSTGEGKNGCLPAWIKNVGPGLLVCLAGADGANFLTAA